LDHNRDGALFDDQKVKMVPFTGPSVALWGPNYAHGKGTYPHSQVIVAKFAKLLSPEDTRAIVFDPAADLVRFNREKILEPVLSNAKVLGRFCPDT
jgi:hypothetical protein